MNRSSRCTHVLLLLAVVAVRLVPSVIAREGDGRNRREGDTLVSRAEEHIELGDPRRREDLGVRIRRGVEQGARVQQTGVEEVRRDTAVSAESCQVCSSGRTGRI